MVVNAALESCSPCTNTMGSRPGATGAGHAAVGAGRSRAASRASPTATTATGRAAAPHARAALLGGPECRIPVVATPHQRPPRSPADPPRRRSDVSQVTRPGGQPGRRVWCGAGWPAHRAADGEEQVRAVTAAGLALGRRRRSQRLERPRSPFSDREAQEHLTTLVHLAVAWLASISSGFTPSCASCPPFPIGPSAALARTPSESASE